MPRKHDPLDDIRRALDPLKEARRALGLPGQPASILQTMRADPVRDALSGLRETGALASVAASGDAMKQFRTMLSADAGILDTARRMAVITAAGDLGVSGLSLSHATASGLAASRTLQTGSAVAQAITALQKTVLGSGVLAGLVRQRDAVQPTASRQLADILKSSGVLAQLGGASSATAAAARAGKWAAEGRLVDGTLAAMARSSGLGAMGASSLMDAVTRRSAGDWRTILDSVMGASLAGMRPAALSAYAAIHRGSLPLLALRSGLGGAGVSASPALHLADQLGRMHASLGELIDPVGAVLAASRGGGSTPPAAAAAIEALVAGAADLQAGLSDAAASGTVDALLRFLDGALARLGADAWGEFAEMGPLARFMLLVALFQFTIWVHPEWTPQPSTAPQPAIERVEREQRELSTKFDRVAEMLARNEADNLAHIGRALLRGNAIVRAGPGTAFAQHWRLSKDEVVGVRDREDGWTLVFYRDPLSGAVGSGWVSSRLLAPIATD